MIFPDSEKEGWKLIPALISDDSTKSDSIQSSSRETQSHKDCSPTPALKRRGLTLWKHKKRRKRRKEKKKL